MSNLSEGVCVCSCAHVCACVCAFVCVLSICVTLFAPFVGSSYNESRDGALLLKNFTVCFSFILCFALSSEKLYYSK